MRIWPPISCVPVYCQCCWLSVEAWASADVSGVKWTSFSYSTSLSGCRLHSSACQIQPRPVGCLSVHSWRTEVRHSHVMFLMMSTLLLMFVWDQLPATISKQHLVVSVRNNNKWVFINFSYSVRSHSSCLLMLDKTTVWVCKMCLFWIVTWWLMVLRWCCAVLLQILGVDRVANVFMN